MVAKQLQGQYTPDGSKYFTLTDGVGNLIPRTTLARGSSKQNFNAQSPDGSIYLTPTNGAGALL